MVKPLSNLPPESQPWARSVDDDISQLRFDIDKAAKDTDRALKNVNSTLTGLTEQVALIAETQASLSVVVANLDSAVADIEALGLNQVAARTGNNSAGYPAFTAPTSASNYATVNITTPAGYTQCYVMAVISAVFIVSSPADSLQYRVAINGLQGPLGTSFPSASSAENVSNSYAVQLTGLTPGAGVVSISAQMNSALGSGSVGGISTSAVVIFLK